jgi:Zn finger protein HypA/HybF involved in hydrogenase expression
MQSLKEKYDEYIANIRAKSPERLTSYSCPECLSEIYCLKPADEYGVYDSSTICPHCEGTHVKIVDGYGNVETHLAPESIPNEKRL